uniref:Uncharacterized protein n=1 Tax=Tetranychus urticae TaxID=32264 RepID=T1K692_TETUR
MFTKIQHLISIVIFNLITANLFALAEIDNQTIPNSISPLINPKGVDLIAQNLSMQCDCSSKDVISDECRTICGSSPQANSGKKINYVPIVVILSMVVFLGAVTYITLYLKNRPKSTDPDIGLDHIKTSENKDKVAVEVVKEETNRESSNVTNGHLEEVVLNE